MRSPFVLLPFLPLALVAQDASEKELLALLNTPVTVASTKAMTMRESPGVITYITREEIQASGARDLIDILRLVPGLDFAYDTQGAVGLSARGLWAYEGKALLLWDGIEMPELLYGNTLYGHRFPMDQIKRIEVIRGPGSAMYGGLAELAVIKVVSLDYDDLKNGGEMGLMMGRGASDTLRTQGQLMAGSMIGGGKFTFGASYEKGLRSDDPVITSGGVEADSSTRSAIYSKLLHMSYSLGGFQARMLVDDYQLGDTNATNADMIPTAQKTDFQSQNLDLRYETSLGAFKLTPVVSYRRITPWNVHDSDGWHPRTIQAMRYTLGLAWQPTQAWSLAGGLEHRTEFADVGSEAPAGYHLSSSGLDSVSYDTSAAFLQAEYAGVVNLTLGGRYEKHNVAGDAFVPRVAITKVLDQWHFKLLYANAFRTPNIGNLARPMTVGLKIEPEKTRAIEAEVGRQIGAGIFTLNIFDTRLEKPLVWANSGNGPTATSGYRNGDPISTRGGELEYKWRQAWGFLNVSYAYHQAVDQGVPDWAVPGEDKRFLGMANHKVGFLASVKVADGWTLNPSAIYLGDRYGYDWNATAGDLELTKFKSEVLLNLNLAYAGDGWMASLGVFDALNRKPPFVQSYYSDVPLHGPSREVVLKVRWGF